MCQVSVALTKNGFLLVSLSQFVEWLYDMNDNVIVTHKGGCWVASFLSRQEENLGRSNQFNFLILSKHTVIEDFEKLRDHDTLRILLTIDDVCMIKAGC